MDFPWSTILEYAKISPRLHLPWREYASFDTPTLLYRVWISEILLQQTQAERVVPFFERIIQAFPHMSSLASTDYDTFFWYYQGMGYYSRAKNMLKTAHIICSQWGWIFPDNKKDLLTLPGIGEYTSSALLAFWYGKPFLAWDTNLEKVFSRYLFGTSSQKLTPPEKREIEQSFVQYIGTWAPELQADSIRHINNGLMDFARLNDEKNPEKIDWDSYPIKSGRFYKTRWNEEKVSSRKSITFPTPDATVIVILHSNHKEYFSESFSEYLPFSLPPSHSRDTRKYVQDYFRTHYNMEVSVRPIHHKWLSRQWAPYVMVNAQRQTGVNPFWSFSKDAARQVLSTFMEQ